MKLTRTKPYLAKEDIAANPQLKRVDRPLPDAVKQLVPGKPLNLEGTLLDEQVNMHGGYVPIPSKYRMVNIYIARRKLEKRYLTLDRDLLHYLSYTDKSLIHEPPEGSGIYIPPGVSKTFTTDDGLDVLTPLQKRYDDLVSLYQEWVGQGAKYDRKLELEWLQAYDRLLQQISHVLLQKAGLYDRAVGCLWNYSLRAVIVPDPTLQLNEVELPMKVLIRWVSKKEFRDAVGIPDDINARDAVRMLAGRRVILGRQPSHFMPNLLSFKLRVRG